MSEATVRLYHPNGAEVQLPIQITFQSASADIETYTKSGWLIRPPEKTETINIGYIVRRSKLNKITGEETPVIDLFGSHPKMNRRFLMVYLNKPEQIQAFEIATGLKLDQIKFFNGDAPPKNEDGATNREYIVRLEKTVNVAYKANPAYDPDEKDESKKKPARLFIRWLDKADWYNESNPTPHPASPQNGVKSSPPPTAAPATPKDEGASNNQWWLIVTQRNRVIEAFAKFGIRGKDKIVEAMGQLEPGVTKLSETKAPTLEDYIAMIDRVYEAW